MTSSAPSSTEPQMKLCFVTVGATASFELLLTSVLDDLFIQALKKAGYTHLLLQYGKDGRPIFDTYIRDCAEGTRSNLDIQIDGFDFNQAGLGREMRLAQQNPKERRTGGMIISHAGSGSILEALRLGIPLVVVPNPTLKDNHQLELAQELQNQGYVIASHVSEIHSAVEKAEALRSQMLNWPPSRAADQINKPTLADVMFDEMGFLD